MKPPLSTLAALALCLVPAVQGEARTPAAPTVTTESGQVEGVAQASGGQVFMGIPYAAPPVRDLRWKAPRPAAAWTGVFHADRFGPQCIQPLRNAQANQYGGAEVTSEDCLYLNVWTRPGLRKAPVIVYIHGGAFFIGSSAMPIYGGEAVAAQGAVFVNFNYRLGALGFLAHPELSAESPQKVSGDYAFLDQIAALQWVRRNIARFGGDPDNVTIAGQSAGSMSVQVLQASPLAKGLFKHAFAMSGAAAGGPSSTPPLAQAEQEGVKLQTVLHARSLAELRAMPADRIVVPRTADGPKIGPVQDGYVLPESIDQTFQRGRQNDVPLVVGFTHDESFGGLGPVRDLPDYLAKARARFGDRAPEFLALYPASDDAAARDAARAADRDATMAAGMGHWADIAVANGKSKVYSYEFARPHSYAPGAKFSDLDPATAGAYHTSEVPFWLGTLDSFNIYRTTRAWTPADYAFSTEMTRSLVAFARTGNPDTTAMTWRPYTPDAPVLLGLNQVARIMPWPDRRKLEFFRSLGQAQAVGAVRD
jgi:para-nitrobenzyl esterase